MTATITRTALALHEARHAVVAHHLGARLTRIVIADTDARTSHLGRTTHTTLPPGHTAAVTVAPYVALGAITGPGSSGDQADLDAIPTRHHPPAWATARAVLDAHPATVVRLALAIERAGNLPADTALTILDDTAKDHR